MTGTSISVVSVAVGLRVASRMGSLVGVAGIVSTEVGTSVGVNVEEGGRDAGANQVLTGGMKVFNHMPMVAAQKRTMPDKINPATFNNENFLLLLGGKSEGTAGLISRSMRDVDGRRAAVISAALLYRFSFDTANDLAMTFCKWILILVVVIWIS